VCVCVCVCAYVGGSFLCSRAMHITPKCTNILSLICTRTLTCTYSQAQKDILHDFFTHAFDGSGGDNFFDAGIIMLCGVVLCIMLWSLILRYVILRRLILLFMLCAVTFRIV
jgi:Protein of unknown function (DUF2009)